MTKTNVMRLLEQAGIDYTALAYPVDEADLSGEHAAEALGLPVAEVFKTLVLRGERTGLFVCCLPSHEAIDLRKAARAAGDKKAELLPMKDLLPATGYLRGGCSPIGMKRKYPLFIDDSCTLFDRVTVSAGVRGAVVYLAPGDLIAYTGAQAVDLCQLGGGA